jgi:hypothetical protein
MARRLLVAVLLAAGCAVGYAADAPPWERAADRAEPQRYFPAWYDVQPHETIRIQRDPELSDTENGAALKSAISRLQPGQMLQIGGGRWSIDSYFQISLRGTAEAPIWIVAAPGETPVITRPDARQNAVNVGDASAFLCLRGLEITGGSQLLRLHDCHDIWVDRCHLHHGEHGALTANSADTHRLHITRCEIHHPGGPEGTNEGMYLGANNGKYVMRDSVVALNHVHSITIGTQGDGIEVKGGSHNNWIVANTVHDTRYPCILVYGAGGNGVNLVERNVCWRSGNYTMQVTGEAIVRNNLVMGGDAGAFGSTDNQGRTHDLRVVHNTFINTGIGANLTSWNAREGLVFANNAVYSRDAASIRFPRGSEGVALAGNVVLGAVTGASHGFIDGRGLSDFAQITWDWSCRDATPSADSVLPGAGEPRFATALDLSGRTRLGRVDAGALDADHSPTDR